MKVNVISGLSSTIRILFRRNGSFCLILSTAIVLFELLILLSSAADVRYSHLTFHYITVILSSHNRYSFVRFLLEVVVEIIFTLLIKLSYLTIKFKLVVIVSIAALLNALIALRLFVMVCRNTCKRVSSKNSIW